MPPLPDEETPFFTEPGAQANDLAPSTTLLAGQSVSSASGQYQLSMLADGNLVLYAEGSTSLWASGTVGNPGAYATLQGDGNLVIYSAAGQALWSTGTTGNPGAYLDVQGDGAVVIYSADGASLWSTGTYNDELMPGEELTAGESLQSPDGTYLLIMQGDGNLVLYIDGVALWNSQTHGYTGAYAAMQSDGNLVIYSSTGQALWYSQTHGYSGAYLVVQDDGNVVLHNAAGTSTLWQTGTAGEVLLPGQELTGGQGLTSPNGLYQFDMQTDGNLVLYKGATALWSSQTDGHPGAYVVMQTDGNLVVYSAAGQALWDSQTHGYSGAYLILQDDGDAVIYGSGEQLWATATVGTTLSPGDTLADGEELSSTGGSFQLVMQSDGNLVLYTQGTALWNSQTSGNPGAYAVMQSDGNLVVYSSTAQALWNSGTSGNPGAYAVMQSDGNFVVYNAAGQALWNSGTSGGVGSISPTLEADVERAETYDGQVYQSDGTQWSGNCLHFVTTMLQGFPDAGGYSAYTNWLDNGSPDQGTVPPRGAMVYYSYGTLGHIGISLGGGIVISTNGDKGQGYPITEHPYNGSSSNLPGLNSWYHEAYLGWAMP